MGARKLRATRDIIYNNTLVVKGAVFEYLGEGTHKYGAPVDVPQPAPAKKVQADLKPEAARKVSKDKAINPSGDADLT